MSASSPPDLDILPLPLQHLVRDYVAYTLSVPEPWFAMMQTGQKLAEGYARTAVLDMLHPGCCVRIIDETQKTAPLYRIVRSMHPYTSTSAAVKDQFVMRMMFPGREDDENEYLRLFRQRGINDEKAVMVFSLYDVQDQLLPYLLHANDAEVDEVACRDDVQMKIAPDEILDVGMMALTQSSPVIEQWVERLEAIETSVKRAWNAFRGYAPLPTRLAVGEGPEGQPCWTWTALESDVLRDVQIDEWLNALRRKEGWLRTRAMAPLCRWARMIRQGKNET
jgi:hypothetical protein